ncbi:hypothetical protein SAMN02745134_00949 [Clostridium acidisoli DSM 12555]|uniref:Uncharacterized protein n=1 Tax=Clostridium acidisoli DSM 12555 TaxID=1121291 RepID=A0A1W1X7J1_9CLOT|nr:exonuclease SbcCD subunit D C-terminal domain-containing protein [Clostridium acidisoli]SMC19866.1 hypothetical protein SAMN02745134_00949 [Clostridium acidisoli DSM 12555]
MSIAIKTYKNKFQYNLNKNEIILTLNIPSDEVKFLFETAYGKQFYAKDEQGIQGEDVAKNISNLYKIISKTATDKFVSLAVRTDFDNAGYYSCYGDVVVLVDKKRISDDVVIFNGDVKDIAKKVMETDNQEKWVEIHYMNEPNLYERLKKLFENANSMEQKIPRKMGKYFEARMQRALTPEDILEIYIDEKNVIIKKYVQSVI